MNEESPEEFVVKRIADINSKKAYEFACANPKYPDIQQKADHSKILVMCSALETHLPKIEELIRRIFDSVSIITEQTKVVAVYLLIGKAYSNLQSSLLLCREGKNIEAMELSRSGKEALDLAMLFWEDENKNLLDKWFTGKIISNSESREFQHKFLNKELADKFNSEEQPIEDMLKESYKIMSIYTHSSYAGLLDSVDVFKLDFDFAKNAGYHYCVRNFHIVEDLVVKILLQLKNSFAQLKDKESFREADEIYKLFEVNLSDEELKEIISKRFKSSEPKQNT